MPASARCSPAGTEAPDDGHGCRDQPRPGDARARARALPDHADVRPAVAYLSDIRLDVSTGGEKQFEGENPQRGTAIQFYLKSPGDAKIAISDQSGRTVCESNVKAVAGINRVQWTLVAPLLSPAAGGGRGGRGGEAPLTPPAAPAPNPNAGSCSGATGGRGGGGGAGSATPGSYVVKLTVNGREYVKPVAVLGDKWMTER